MVYSKITVYFAWDLGVIAKIVFLIGLSSSISSYTLVFSI